MRKVLTLAGILLCLPFRTLKRFTTAFTLFTLLAASDLSGQIAPHISFKSTKDTISRDSIENKLYRYAITRKGETVGEMKNIVVNVIVDTDNTTLPASMYNVYFSKIKMSELDTGKEYVFFVELESDTLPDRERKIALEFSIIDTLNKKDITDKNLASNKTFNIIIHKLAPPPVRYPDSLSYYKYLAYIGTNFDLVDGIQANNLFFASNIFVQPRVKLKSEETTGLNVKKWRLPGAGIYLSLYGNRTASFSDTSNVVRVARLVPISDSTYLEQNESALATNTISSDNLGAHISILIGVSNEERAIRTYPTVSSEFIWRRTTSVTEYSNGIISDSTVKSGILSGEVVLPSSSVRTYNQFQFNLGPGWFISHENERLSMRVQMSAGYSRIYEPAQTKSSAAGADFRDISDIFFSGRAWITEAKSGLTLQAEVTNTLKVSRPFYGVTLSKAIDFEKLGNVFSPISTR